MFTGHEELLTALRDYLVRPHPNPWAAVCEASVMVFRRFAALVTAAHNHVAYATQHIQFGKPLARFQMVQERLAQILKA